MSNRSNLRTKFSTSSATAISQSFVDFMLARSLDTIKLVHESVRSALAPSAEESVAAINSLYITKGGYTHEQVDKAGLDFMEIVQEELRRAISKNSPPKVSGKVNALGAGYSVPSGYRTPLIGARILQVAFNSTPPAQAQVSRSYGLLLPRDAAGDDDIQLFANASDIFAARIDEIMPAVSGALRIRLSMFAERVVGELLHQLRMLAESAMREGH